MLNPNPIDPTAFSRHLGRWNAGSGPEDDVVISSRVRLARNLADHRFRPRADESDARRVAQEVRDSFEAEPLDGDTRYVAIDEASHLTRLLLCERYLCSRDLAPAEGPNSQGGGLGGRAVIFGMDEDISVMVNEEDHLRMQSLAAGFDLHRVCERAVALDRSLEQRLDFAFDTDLGYLTGCPTNVGTGMRASVMLHLPALSLVREQLEKVIRSAQRTGLAVRGIYGEGSRAMGDFFQISNQITLGRSEDQLVDDLVTFVPSIVKFERQVRAKLAKERMGELLIRLDDARETLGTARSMSSDEALTLLSCLRLAKLVGLEGGLDQPDFGRLVIQVQQGHVHAAQGEALDLPAKPSQRDGWRAAFLRQRFGH